MAVLVCRTCGHMQRYLGKGNTTVKNGAISHVVICDECGDEIFLSDAVKRKYTRLQHTENICSRESQCILPGFVTSR